MFSFTKRADYALLALSYLATAAMDDPLRLVNTKEISDKYHIPIEMLAKILQVMARSGLRCRKQYRRAAWNRPLLKR